MDRFNAHFIDKNLIIAAETGDVESITKCQTDYIDSLPWHKRKDWSDIDIEDAVPDSKGQGLFWMHGIYNVQEARRGLFNKIAKNYYGRLHTDSIIDGINALSKYMLDYKSDMKKTINRIICDKCSKENVAGALMCIRCGKSFDYTNPMIGHTQEETRALEDARISMEQKIKRLHASETLFNGIICDECGKENVAGALMCIRCGRPFDYTIPMNGRTPEENRVLKEARISMERKIKQFHAITAKKGNVLTKISAAQSIIKRKHSGQSVVNNSHGIIGVKDFVVRRSAFKCMHSQHTIKNIEAILKVMKKRDGAIVDKKVSAGFCEECNTFFILESTFEDIKKYGIPLCRVSDEKTYLSNGKSGNLQMAQESILMQFGYNVSQNEGLSDATRHRILAVIIDNHILSKSEIISYLDFFISQRISQHKYEIAISKWERDKEFVSGYRQGEFTQYGVNSIYR